MIKGNLYQFYFSNLAKVILLLIVVSWVVFLFFIIKEGNSFITKISFGSAVISMFIGPFFVNNIRILGEIRFEEDRLVIFSGVEEIVFLLDEIERIYVYYEGYKNQDDSNPYIPLSFKDGAENEIGFNYNGEKIRYKFQILDEKFLVRLIKQWKSLKNPEVRIYREDRRSKIIWTNYK